MQSIKNKMKKILSILSLSLLFISCGEKSSTVEPKLGANNDKDNYIAVYDFHNEHRCVTCLAIEKATKEVLNDTFKKNLDDGTIVFELYNCEAPENRKLAEEYFAFGTTLAITVFKDGEKEIDDITNWAFETVKGDNYKKELIEKLNIALKKLK